MKALKKLLLSGLAEMYDSEKRIAKALPKISKAATCEKLQQILQTHLEETGLHAIQVERVFALFEERPKARKCEAIIGILKEGDTIIAENKKSPAINAAIISACQKVEHYEIASYGALRAWANLLDNDDAADLLEEILDQEKDADNSLNELAVAKNKETLNEVEIGSHPA